jgi:isopenicillin N synthase-like dioxygenase
MGDGDAVALVDISAWTSSTDDGFHQQAAAAAAAAFADALRTAGFVQVTGHGADPDVMAAAVAAAALFFGQSEAEKRLACSKDRARRGYSPSLAENFASLLPGAPTGTPNDAVEKFRLGPLVDDAEKAGDPAYYDCKEGRLHFYSNTWDGTPPTFAPALTAYYRAMEGVAAVLVRLLEAALGLPAGHFAGRMRRHTSILTVNHYPPLPPASSSNNRRDELDVRVAAHTDVSMFTVVAQTPAPGGRGGLQMYHAATDTYRTVPHVPGALVVNIGDCLRDWSGGRLASTRHRVALAPTGDGESGAASRYSLAYFVSPDHDAVLDWPAEGGAGDGAVEAGAAAGTYAQWRKDRIKTAMKPKAPQPLP